MKNLQEEMLPKDLFSQEEIKNLFDAINGGRTPSDEEDAGPLRKIQIYDFKRPNRFSEEHKKALSEVHKKTALSWTKLFNQYLQSEVEIKFSSLDILNFDEFIRSMPTPTSIIISEATMDSVPLPNSFLIEIDPGTAIPDKCDLTKISKELLDEYAAIWNKLYDMELSFHKKAMEMNPHHVNIDLLSEMGALITMEVKNGDVEGMVNVWLSYLFLKPLLPYLAGTNKVNIAPKKLYKEINSMNSNNDSQIETGLDNLNIQVVAELGRTMKKLKEIKEVQEGHIMELDNDVYGPICVFVNNVLFAHAETCVVDDKFALRILEIFDENSLIKEQS